MFSSLYLHFISDIFKIIKGSLMSPEALRSFKALFYTPVPDLSARCVIH